MSLWLGREDPARHQQVLPEEFALDGAAFFVTVVKARHEAHHAGVSLAESPPVADEGRKAPNRTREAQWVEPELARPSASGA